MVETRSRLVGREVTKFSFSKDMRIEKKGYIRAISNTLYRRYVIMRKKITILVPAYNEAQSIPLLYRQLRRLIDSDIDWGDVENNYDWEILIVDDGSRDSSSEVLCELRGTDNRVNFISLSRNFGKENAMLAGMDFATGDAVVIMDADLQHPVETIPEMIKYWEEGYDDVYGKRLSRGKEPFLRKKFSLAYYNILQKSTNIEILQNVGDFRLLDRQCVDAIRQLRESQRNTKGLFCWVGFKKKAVDFETNDSTRASSTFKPMKLLSLAVEGITGFTTAPLRFATIMGVIVSIAAFVYIIVILSKTIFWGEPVRGFPTIMCAILFLGGCQLLALGIIGEYTGRIFNETKRRPPYIVKTHNGHPLSHGNNNHQTTTK